IFKGFSSMDKAASHEELIMEKLDKSLRGGASEMLFSITQLRGIHKHNKMVEANLKSRSKALELKEKELQTLSSELKQKVETFEKEKAEAGDMKKLVDECGEELRLKRNELTAKLDTSSRLQREIEVKRSQWTQHSAEIGRLCSETSKKKNELAVTLEKVKECEKRFKMKSLELASKEKDLRGVRESIEVSDSELEVKKKMVVSLNNEIDSKSKESREIKKLIEQQTSELVVMQKQLDSIRSSCEMEERAKEIKDKEKELELLKHQLESEEKKLLQLKREMEVVTGIKKKDLELTLSKIEESSQQLASVNHQLESQRRQLEMQSVEQVSKQMEFESFRESSKRLVCDLEVKEKRLQELNNLIKLSGEQLNLKSKALGEIERELKLKRRLRQMSTVLVNREKQPISSQQNVEEETELIDTLMPDGISASLTRHEVSSVLRATPNPAGFVLEQVQDGIREGSTFQDTFLETLVLIFEELVKIQGPDESQLLQLQATEVATLWKERITIEAPKSTLEALAFLLFIIAYGLKALINEEETALLASSIAQYGQAPRLFVYLSLNPKIREFVEELIKKGLYIPAVRLICLFNLDKEDKDVSFSRSELLKKEIITFRRSALENRSTESSQVVHSPDLAKGRDGGRLRAILELVADYKLKIDLPGDLIAKLMVEGERSAPVAHCSVIHVASSSNPQAGLKKKKQLGQTKTVLVQLCQLMLSPSNSEHSPVTRIRGEGTEEKHSGASSRITVLVSEVSFRLLYYPWLDFERFIMDCNKEEATRAMNVAEEKMRCGDFVGAQKLVMKAQRLFPELENVQKLLAVCDVHSSADKKIKGLDDWYGILQVQPSADSDTIKKQYRKLCLLLHPDKNKFPGAEAAFKFVGEANRWLSDQIKRSQYDVRYRSHSLFASRESNANSLRSASSSVNTAAVNIASGLTFWTCCRNCGHRYKYLKVYVNQVMRCSSCQKSYTACNIGSDEVPFGSSTADANQEMNNTSRQHPCTGAESGSSSAAKAKNETVGKKINKRSQKKQKREAGDKKPKKDEGCTESEAEGGRPGKGERVSNNSVEVPKPDVLKPQPEVKEPETSAAAEMNKNGTVGKKLNKRSQKKQKREAGDKKPKKNEVKEPETSAAAEMNKNGTVRGKLNKRNQKRVAGDKKPEKDEGCIENDAEAGRPQIGAEIPKPDILKPQPEEKEPQNSAGKSMPDLSAPKTKQTARKKRKSVEESSMSFEVDGSDAAVDKTDTDESNKRKPQVSYAEKRRNSDSVIPPTKKTKSGCEVDESDVNTKQTDEDNTSLEPAEKGKAKESENSGNNNIFSVENGHNKADENRNTLEIPDPEFNVFEDERRPENFAVNQVWSTCDSRDGMPRRYARVRKVLSSDFKLRVTYLKPVQENNDESIPVTWGKFNNGETKDVENRSIFSGQMLHSVCNRVVSIYPRKGEIWAMFSDWDEESSTLENHELPYKYDVVEIVNDFKEEAGIGAAYLGKVKGFVSLFQREAKNTVCQVQLAPERMLRFSHKVPAVKMTGTEKEGVPAGSYELDPTALPKDIFQVEESAKQGDKMKTPKTTDKGLVTDSLGINESSKGIQQRVESQVGEGSKKRGRDGELPSSSKQNDLPAQLDGSTNKLLETTPASSSCKTPQRNAFDFNNERSVDKFRRDQTWAIYSDDKGMPTEYVKIKKVETKPELVLHVAHMELCPPSTEPVTRSVSCGEFKMETGKPKTLPLTRFSHRVKPFDSKQKIVKVYPRKGDIWALRKSCDSTEEEHDIVEVVEGYCEGKSIKAMALTAKGFSSIYTRKHGSHVSSLVIPKAEMSRFSHQVPAVKQEKRATRLAEGGYWELDPAAIPPPTTIVID
ncbi:hypothetical protein HID58_020137, partial [Brassica napus]